MTFEWGNRLTRFPKIARLHSNLIIATLVIVKTPAEKGTVKNTGNPGEDLTEITYVPLQWAIKAARGYFWVSHRVTRLLAYAGSVRRYLRPERNRLVIPVIPRYLGGGRCPASAPAPDRAVWRGYGACVSVCLRGAGWRGEGWGTTAAWLEGKEGQRGSLSLSGWVERLRAGLEEGQPAGLLQRLARPLTPVQSGLMFSCVCVCVKSVYGGWRAWTAIKHRSICRGNNNLMSLRVWCTHYNNGSMRQDLALQFADKLVKRKKEENTVLSFLQIVKHTI